MRILTGLLVLMMASFAFATEYNSEYDGLILNTIMLRETIGGFFDAWSINEDGQLAIQSIDADTVTCDVLSQPLDLAQASITVTGLASVGTTLAVAGASTLTGAVDCVAALTCATIVSDATVEATTTVTAGTGLVAGTTLTVGTNATIAGDITGVDSCSVTDLDVSVNAIVDGSLTSATYNFADATAVGGSKNAITLDFTPDLTVAVGTVIYYVSEFLNDAATTINVDGAGIVNIYDSADVGACSGGEIVDNMVVHLVWDGIQYQLLNTAL